MQIVYFPPGAGGVKVGLDDYVAAGHTVEELLAPATAELREPPKPSEPKENVAPPLDYEATAAGLMWYKDGAFDIEATLHGAVHHVLVPADQFPSMAWATAHLGAGAVVYAGITKKDHARAAIQLLSGDPPKRRVFTHTGWHELPQRGEWYLHGAGAIGATGAVPDVAVRLPEGLKCVVLPEPPIGDALATAILASLRVLNLASDPISVPLWSAIWRVVLGGSDVSVHLSGDRRRPPRRTPTV